MEATRISSSLQSTLEDWSRNVEFRRAKFHGAISPTWPYRYWLRHGGKDAALTRDLRHPIRFMFSSRFLVASPFHPSLVHLSQIVPFQLHRLHL